MNLTVEEYKRLRIEEQMNDLDILELCHYARTSKRSIRRWKIKNGIPLGRQRIYLIDREELAREVQENGVYNTAQKYRTTTPSLNRYIIKGY